MRRILLDTNAYAAFKRGAEEPVEILRRTDFIGVNAVVVGELLSGFAAGQREADNRRELNTFLNSPRVEVLAIAKDTAEFYSRVYLSLRRKGKPIPTNDLWIAASALQHGAAVFTYDQHFDAIDGLIVGSRLADFLP